MKELMNSQALEGIDTHSRTESSASWRNDGASGAEREAETGRVAVEAMRVEAERHVSMRATQANKTTGEQPEGQLKREPGEEDHRGNNQREREQRQMSPDPELNQKAVKPSR